MLQYEFGKMILAERHAAALAVAREAAADRDRRIPRARRFTLRRLVSAWPGPLPPSRSARPVRLG